MLWKNGVAQELGGYFDSLSSVFVSDGNVYVVGNEKLAGGDVHNEPTRATLVKNGVAMRLSNENSKAYSVFVK
jgi:hypothetical protein